MGTNKPLKRWERRGHIFVASGQYPWMLTHAAYPTVEHRGGDTYRVYFACRDAQSYSHVGFVEIDINKPEDILRLSPEPVIGPGPRGSFDENGVTPACFIRIGELDCLYYMGWVVGKRVFARNSIGLAVRKKGEDVFRKYSPAPIFDRHELDPYNITYNWVLPRLDGGYRMWYGSHLTWGEKENDEDMRHVIKYAESNDGIHWQRDGLTVIPLLKEGEVGVSRPVVVQDSDRLRMWYSVRGEKYKLGYAESKEGKNWQRMDEQAGFEADPGGWEQGSIHYACLFDHKGQRFMLYNGGRYGSGGFGLAVQCD